MNAELNENNLVELGQKIQSMALEYETVGKRLMNAIKEHTLAKAALDDAEMSWGEDYFLTKPCKISELSLWVKVKTRHERQREMLARGEVQYLEAQKNTVEGPLNALKIKYRIADLEARNLHYQP